VYHATLEIQIDIVHKHISSPLLILWLRSDKWALGIETVGIWNHSAVPFILWSLDGS
jgi:hypothetical protein